MSKVKYKEPVLEMSGSDGELVHSRNRYGPYTRRKTKNKYKATKARVKANDSLSDVARAYNTLTDSQIRLWTKKLDTFRLRSSKTGKFIKTGRTFFITINKSLVEIGEKIKKDLPNMIPAQTIVLMETELYKEDGKEEIRLHLSEPIDPDNKVIIYATKPLGRGKPVVDKSWYKRLGWIDSSFLTGETITDLYKKKYKAIGEDTYKIGFKFRIVNKNSGLSYKSKEFIMYTDPKSEL